MYRSTLSTGACKFRRHFPFDAVSSSQEFVTVYSQPPWPINFFPFESMLPILHLSSTIRLISTGDSALVSLSWCATSPCKHSFLGGVMAAGSNESERGSVLQSCLDQLCGQEQKLAELRRSKGPFDRAVRALTTNIRESYESIILEKLPSSEAVEQQLWRLHYSFIEEFRARLGKLKAAALAAANVVPNKKKAVEKQKFERVGGQYKCFLDEATGFYHGLIAKLGAKHGLSGTKLSSPSNRTEISSSNERFRRCQYVCHRCYIYLGDLARYKELHLVVEGRTADWHVAANYYRQASALWPAGGNPHNQLGVLATYGGDTLQALYHYLYSLAVHVPFSTARANAKLLFEKNQHHNSQLSNSPEEDMAIDIQMAQAFESHKSSTESHKECPLARLQRRFRVHFITLIGLLFNKSGLEELSELSTPVLREAQLLLSQDNMLITSSVTLEKSNPRKNQSFNVMQLVVLLILSIHNVAPKKEKSLGCDITELSPLGMQAIIFAFQFMTVVLQHCTRVEEPCCNHLFPAVVVFCNWLSSYPDFCQQIQGAEECEKFGREACLLLSKCMQQAKNHDNDSIAYSEKEGHQGTETVLWEDKELCGIVLLKYLETSEIGMRLSTKSAHNAAESACMVRVERLMKALKFLSSVLKLDSSDLVSKSPFGTRASPSEPTKCSQSSGGSVRTSADGSMELKTQGPCILSSNCRKKDRMFLKARDRRSVSVAGPPKLNITSLPSEGSYQHKTITDSGELKVSTLTALQQPESQLCANNSNVEAIPEDPVRNNLVEQKDDGTLCGSVGRGALSLGDWVKAPVAGGNDDNNVDASPALKKWSTRSRPGVVPGGGSQQQAQTHSSGEESLNPSLSFRAVCKRTIPKPLLVPSRRNADVGDTSEKEIQHIEVCKETTGHQSEEEDDTKKKLDDVDIEPSKQIPLATSVEVEGVRSAVHVTSAQELNNNSSQVLLGQSGVQSFEVASSHENRMIVDDGRERHGPAILGSEPECSKQAPQEHNQRAGSSVDTPTKGLEDGIQSFPDHEVASSHENRMIIDGRQRHGPATLDSEPGCSKQAPQEHNQRVGSSVDTRTKDLDCSTGRGKKRKHEAMDSLPSSRCQNCCQQGASSPGEGATSERLIWSTPPSRNYYHHDVALCCSPGSDMDRRTCWHPSKRPRLKEWDGDDLDYSWLDEYTHVVPQALTKLASAMRKALFSFSDFGIFLEFGASVNTVKFNLGLGQPREQQ